MYRTFVDRRG